MNQAQELRTYKMSSSICYVMRQSRGSIKPEQDLNQRNPLDFSLSSLAESPSRSR